MGATLSRLTSECFKREKLLTCRRSTEHVQILCVNTVKMEDFVLKCGLVLSNMFACWLPIILVLVHYGTAKGALHVNVTCTDSSPTWEVIKV